MAKARTLVMQGHMLDKNGASFCRYVISERPSFPLRHEYAFIDKLIDDGSIEPVRSNARRLHDRS